MSNTIETNNLIGPDKVMDVRPIPCSVKHGLIIRNWLDDDEYLSRRRITRDLDRAIAGG
mgnify:CR=1 FL=1